MRAHLIQIGNSKGIRIPKSVLEHCHLEGAVELQPFDNELVIRSLSKPRNGWKEAFRRMTANGDDILMDDKILPSTAWDQSEWKW